MTLKSQILKRFRTNYLQGKSGFINSQSIQDYAHTHFTRKDGTQFKHETIGRILRMMSEEGLLESKLMDGKHVNSIAYSYNPSEHEKLSLNMKHYAK